MICNILMCICPKDFALQNPTVLFNPVVALLSPHSDSVKSIKWQATLVPHAARCDCFWAAAAASKIPMTYFISTRAPF